MNHLPWLMQEPQSRHDLTSSNVLPINFSQSIVAGIVSGLISTSLAWLIYRYCRDIFLPWYQMKLYRGAIIAGTWKGQREDTDAVYGFNIDLQQKGHLFKGTFIAQNARRDGAKTTKTFLLEGESTTR